MEIQQRKEYTPAEQARMRPEFFATKPTGFTRFLRIFLPYQLWRFLVINLKMFRIISKSH
ncbi:MAG: hypothetical protein PVJ76_02470 [Gemmatimonadota bacterium]|jgi:hypothetical protein